MENTDLNTELYKINRQQSALASAIVAFVAETKDVHADSTNPFHKNKYASLSAHLASIKKIAFKHDLAILQLPCTEKGAIGVRTTIIHKEGGVISEFAGVPAGENMTGQQAGAVISYLRRYALASAAGVATEDDDAETDRTARTESQPRSVASATATPRSSPAPSSDDGEVIVPFGKNKGVPMSALSDNDLNWWANTWEPKPWEKTGRVGPKDLALKAAAVKMWNEKNSVASQNNDDVPF